MHNKCCFLDRDGVINKSYVREGKPYPPKTFEEFEIYPEVSEALELLHNAGYLLIIVTNQPDVNRKIIEKTQLELIHRHLLERFPIKDIEVCLDEEGPHNPHYKPKPGMILDAAKKHSIDLAKSFMIGDRWRDVGAGLAAGCRTIFIDRQYSESLRFIPHYTCFNLLEAAQIVLKQSNVKVLNA